MSTYKGEDLFGSGPHRVQMGAIGEVVVANFQLQRPGSGSTPIGPIELDVTVSGILVAESLTELGSLVSAIEDQVVSPVEPGPFIDNQGRRFDDMSFIRFEAGGPVERGRSVSLAYTARFRRFIT